MTGSTREMFDADDLPGSEGLEDFAAVYISHSDAVFGVACRLCGPVLAADVTQDVFVRFWAGPERFDPARGSLRSFLLASANSRAIDLLRAEGSRKARELREGRSVPVAAVEVEQDLLERERSARIARAVNDLPRPERDAIVSAFYGKRTYRDAARVLGAPEGTVKSRIRSGLRLLHATLGDLADSDADQQSGPFSHPQGLPDGTKSARRHAAGYLSPVWSASESWPSEGARPWFPSPPPGDRRQ